jgi:beclin 1
VQSHYALEVNNASLVFRFGPVNLFWSTRFDNAMTWFLTCLQEFAEFAINLDKENNVPFDKSLNLPYK